MTLGNFDPRQKEVMRYRLKGKLKKLLVMGKLHVDE